MLIIASAFLSPASALSQTSDTVLGNVLCAANNDGQSTQSRAWFNTKPLSPGASRSLEADQENYRILFHRGTEMGSDKTKIKITILPKGFAKLRFQKNSPPGYAPIDSKDGELTGGAHGLAVIANVGDQVKFQFSVNGMPETIVTCKVLDEDETKSYHNDPNKLLSLMAPEKFVNPKISDTAMPDKPADTATASGRTKKESRARVLESN